jgi:hypothetical protein
MYEGIHRPKVAPCRVKVPEGVESVHGHRNVMIPMEEDEFLLAQNDKSGVAKLQDFA